MTPTTPPSTSSGTAIGMEKPSTTSTAGSSGTEKPAAAAEKPPEPAPAKKPTALSRWKKLAGTAMFINRLGKGTITKKKEILPATQDGIFSRSSSH